MARVSELVKYGKLLHKSGMVIGKGGNISARDGNTLIVKRKGYDMSCGDSKGYVKYGPVFVTKKVTKYPDNMSSELPMHIACYIARKNIKAVIHVHSPFMVAAAATNKKLKKVSYEFECVMGSDVPVIGYVKPGSERLASGIAKHVKNGANAVLMRRHGAVITGKCIEEAYLRALSLDRACLVNLLSNRGQINK